ncbi:MAG: DEAD/DEAH box helicase, partial [Propionibacteriaceae bacterium]|nr:DEAD/DEAH box helicase [Propionibacteriaceae bacterium]
MTFSDLGLPESVLAAVAAQSYETPTAIQAEAIPALMAGRDVVGVAQTGTGKTAAFGLPLISRLDPSDKHVQALVLAPTRELALQDEAAIAGFAVTTPGVRTLAVYGGAPFLPQKRALQDGVQVVVGTPGRIIDHLDRGTLKLDGVRFLVLDEGDEMLRMGFAEDVDRILSDTPSDRQVALFSATMPSDIRRTAEKHLHDPVEVSVARQSSTVSATEQCYAVVPYKRKTLALSRVLAAYDAEATLVFVRTRAAAEEVGVALNSRGIAASVISGDVPQTEREKVVNRLRSGQVRVLVATDVAARGLDVDRIGLVVNYDLPDDAETYVHRIGRTGRAGRTGVAFSFVTPTETGKLKRIEKGTRKSLVETAIPRTGEVVARRASALLELVPQRIALGRLTAARRSVNTYVAGITGKASAETLSETTDFESLLGDGEGTGITNKADDLSLNRQIAQLTDLAAVLVAFAVGDGLTGNSEDESFDMELDRAERKGAQRRQAGEDFNPRKSGRNSRNDRDSRSQSGDRYDRPSRDRGESWRDDRSDGFRQRDETPRRQTTERGYRGDGPSRYWMGVGREDGVAPGTIVDIMADHGAAPASVGRIEIHGRYTVVDMKTPLGRDELR